MVRSLRGFALASFASECNLCPLRAGVAQLVEQRFRKPQVTGSNRVVGSSPESFRGCRAVTLVKADPFSPCRNPAASYDSAERLLRSDSRIFAGHGFDRWGAKRMG
jgi:hypothetical protein